MPKKKQTTLAELKVGILVTVSLLVLSAVILQQSWGVEWFTSQAKAITYLPDVGGLKPGAPVWLAGMEIGKVTKVTIVPPEIYAGNQPIFRRIDAIHKQVEALEPNQPNYQRIRSDLEDSLRSAKLELRFVEVQLEIRKQYINRISSDSEVSIESRGLIGDSFIEISPGTYGVPPVQKAGFYVIEGVRTTGFREIMTGANDVIANFGVLSQQFKDIALKINPDRVGSGLSDTIQEVQDTMERAKKTFESSNRLIEDLRTGDGTFGRMVSDPAAYNRLVEAIDKLNKVMDQLQNGSGTLAKLMKDPEVFDNANRTLQKADVMMGRIENGEGTLGKLSKDPALYDNTRATIEKLGRFVDQIEKGEGTLGKLYRDPSLYDNLNQSTAEITKLIYDLRQDPKKYMTIRFRLF